MPLKRVLKSHLLCQQLEEEVVAVSQQLVEEVMLQLEGQKAGS